MAKKLSTRRLDISLVVLAAVLISALFVLLLVSALSSGVFLLGMLIVIVAVGIARIVIAAREHDQGPGE